MAGIEASMMISLGTCRSSDAFVRIDHGKVWAVVVAGLDVCLDLGLLVCWEIRDFSRRGLQSRF